jgi:DNA-binding MarR family transcriptional regulator
VSKRAAAKTAARLEHLGYVSRTPHPGDGQRSFLARTTRAEEMLTLSAEIFERLRQHWTQRIGKKRFSELEDDLDVIVSEGGGLRLGDLPSWIR